MCPIKLQEFDITPPPPPWVTEYQVQALACGRCGAVTAGQPPPGITARARYGPEAHAQAANPAGAHHIPAGRAAHRRSKTAKDGRRLARRSRDHQDMILRFATDPAVGFTSSQAERDVRPVKVQQRTSGGSWRTLDGLADFAIVQSYLSTASKWSIHKLDALRQLFTTGPWLPADRCTAIASG